MKNFLRSEAGRLSALICSFWLAAVLLCATAPLTGCSSFSLRQYQAQQAAEVTVTAGMEAWGDYVAKYQPPIEQEQAVKIAYERYQSAQLALIDAAIAVKTLQNAGGPTNAAQEDLARAAVATAESTAELLRLIRSFGVKI